MNNTKQCFVCGEVKSIDDFYTHKKMSDGHLNKCKMCCIKYVHNRDTKHIDIKRYRNNPKRYLSTKYRNIVDRCTGKHGYKTYVGRDYPTKTEWEEWTQKTYKTFISLYRNWQDSNYDRKKAPSVDRIDNNKGYTVDNMQWLTLSANCVKANKEVKRNKKFHSKE